MLQIRQGAEIGTSSVLHYNFGRERKKDPRNTNSRVHPRLKISPHRSDIRSDWLLPYYLAPFAHCTCWRTFTSGTDVSKWLDWQIGLQLANFRLTNCNAKLLFLTDFLCAVMQSMLVSRYVSNQSWGRWEGLILPASIPPVFYAEHADYC